jgi:hypothetical protein
MYTIEQYYNTNIRPNPIHRGQNKENKIACAQARILCYVTRYFVEVSRLFLQTTTVARTESGINSGIFSLTCDSGSLISTDLKN